MCVLNDSCSILGPLRPNGSNPGRGQRIRYGIWCAPARLTPGSVQTLPPYTAADAWKPQNPGFWCLTPIFRLLGHKRCRPPYPICEIKASLERLSGKLFFKLSARSYSNFGFRMTKMRWKWPFFLCKCPLSVDRDHMTSSSFKWWKMRKNKAKIAFFFRL